MAHVLVVDDERSVRELIRAFLEPIGHTVTEAADGEAALTAIHAETADLLVTDNAMPKVTGAELIRRVRADHPNTKIIAMSGFGLRSVTRGADRVLAKPFTRDEFLAVVDEVLVSTT